ncbi:MAG: M28 family peptidase [Gemmatimonadaceae bacterium]|nr:M28 family peptidase [Gemmatimonadaceae bacterium]
MSAARDHLRAIAHFSRPAGSAAEATVRSYCQAILIEAGFVVRHRWFEYSSFPGRWGTPIAGALTALTFLAAGHFGTHGQPRAALALLLAGALVLGVCGWWLGRRGVLDLPFARLGGNNLVAARGTPTVWLVAHLDSKSQPIPIGVRAVAIMASIALWIVAAALASAQLLDLARDWLWIPLTILGVLASLIVAASLVGDRSQGALDNASGVATVLRVAELCPRDLSLGLLLTTAEELGLACARAVARDAPVSQAINVDGIDDGGTLRLSYTGRFPRALVARLGGGWPAPKRLPPGLLMDGVAFADAGWEVINISRGDWRTVARIHTPRDDLAHLEGSGAEALAVMLADAIAAGRR